VTIKTAPSAGSDTVMDVTITANWTATLLCTPGDGNCSDKLKLEAHSSNWRVDHNAGTPVTGSESFSTSNPVPGQPKNEIVCSGPCGKATDIAVSTTYAIQIANGRLLGKPPTETGAGGKIGKGASSGTVSMSLMPTKCPGSGWTTVLSLVGKGTDLHIDWVGSDRDGDGAIDGIDKKDDPTAKPKPKDDPKDKRDPKHDPKAEPKPKAKK
jgi:hypothetical protein